MLGGSQTFIRRIYLSSHLAQQVAMLISSLVMNIYGNFRALKRKFQRKEEGDKINGGEERRGSKRRGEKINKSPDDQ